MRRGGKKTKPIQSQTNPIPPAEGLQETIVPATFGIWIAGKLEFFDGFEILILTNADCRFTIATENRNS